jgi:hypothetical protein
MGHHILPVLGALIVPFAAAQFEASPKPSYFQPSHRLSGVGVDRSEMSETVLSARVEKMIEAQTFAILRDPQALAGAQRITAPKLQAIFRRASADSGFPQDILEAMAYLESFGEPKADSWAGAKTARGIMQVSEATAKRIGLRVSWVTRYKVTKERVQVKRKGRKPVYRTVRHRTPYTVLVRDDRIVPERAIPAAARYLAGMQQRFGSLDWAVFAYHCGEGCVADMQWLTQHARGISGQPSVARMFFGSHPGYNRDLYDAVQRNMQRDYSPTYWFRVMRARRLLAVYREDPERFRSMAEEYRSQLISAVRAPHRLSAWLKTGDLVFQSCEDLMSDQGRRLAKALDDPDRFGYTLRKSGNHSIGALDPGRQEYYSQAAPSTLGTLAYIAFETRRLHEAMKPRGERFLPLEVVSLVESMDSVTRAAASGGNGENQADLKAHCSGHVFDIDTAGLPPGEREALRFVLEDIGDDGYLGFMEETPGSGRIHIGCAPQAREFFTQIFEEALADRR